MNKFIVLSFVVLMVSPVAAEKEPRKASKSPVINLKENIVYKKTEEGDLLLDLYYPEKELSGKYPLLVYTHGGGWSAGSKDKIKHWGRIGGVALRLNKAGFCVAAINYRLCKNEPPTKIRDCVTDAIDAVRYLAKHGDELHIDATRVFSLGESAGGQIAQMLLLAPPEAFPGAEELAGESYNMVAGVSWYGPCDFEKTDLFTPPGAPTRPNRFIGRIVKADTQPDEKLRLIREVSPVNYLTKDSPPLLMIQGDEDATIPVHHAHYMQEGAKDLGAPVEILIIKNAGHNWRKGRDGKSKDPIEPSLGEIVKRTADYIITQNRQLSAETE